MSIKENIRSIRSRIGKAAASVGRDPGKIKLVAVIKTVPIDKVFEALEEGITDIGENRVQDAGEKLEAVKARFPNVTCHMIGHLQRNKVRQALDMFDIIQSVDSERLAEEIDRRAVNKIPVLIEVKTSEETTKHGIPAKSAAEFLKTVSKFDNIQVRGLMTVAPLTDDPETARPYFASLRELSEEIKRLNLPNVEMKYLSMGMTDDFEVAIQEGSNMVRIGRAIFG